MLNVNVGVLSMCLAPGRGSRYARVSSSDVCPQTPPPPPPQVPRGTIAAGGNGNSPGVAVMFVMLVSLFWGSSFVTNLVAFASASVVGSWWFVASPPSPVFNAVKRGLTTSLGTIGARSSTYIPCAGTPAM